jgi:hypothetical protein
MRARARGMPQSQQEDQWRASPGLRGGLPLRTSGAVGGRSRTARGAAQKLCGAISSASGMMTRCGGVPPELIHDAQVAWNALARLELLLTAPPAPAPDHGCIDVKTKGARQWRHVHSWTLKSMPLVSISA